MSNFTIEMKRTLFVILLIVTSFVANSKNDPNFKPVVDTLNSLFVEVIQARTDAQKETLNNEITETLNKFLHTAGSFDHAIDLSLIHI